MKTMAAARFKEQCLKILDAVDEDGLVITRRGRPVAKLIPIRAESASLIGALKGKTTRKAPPRVKEDNVAVPPELLADHKNLVLCMDLMFVNGMPMLTGIDRSVRFRSLIPLENRTSEQLYSALDKVLRHYNAAGYNVERIHCDQEFKPLMDPVKDDLDIQMNYTVTDEHVPEAERNNCTIAERIRATYHILQYKTMPRILLRYLAMVSAHQLNLFPALFPAL